MKLFRCNSVAALCLFLALRGWSLAPAQTAFEIFRWEKPDPHLPYPQSRRLNKKEWETLAKVTLPMKCDYSSLVTLVYCQGAGGCGGYTASAIFDILKKRECPYAPNGSYRFQEYFYNESGKAPAGYRLNQVDVLQRLGCVPETRLPTNYDTKPVPIPSEADLPLARAYRILRYSDVIAPLTVDSLKRMLVLYGPLGAFGDVPGSSPDGHCFALIGYDDRAHKFTILNSYGDGWGENGMMKMPYESIERRPPTQQFPRITSIRYVINCPTPAHLFPYAARLNIHHNESRNHLTVRIGAENQQPETVWDRPNKTVVPDHNRNLVIDVPLPEYAARFWPPSPRHRWFVEVSDDSVSRPETEAIGRIIETILVDRTRAATRTGPPVLYRPTAQGTALLKGGTIRAQIP